MLDTNRLLTGPPRSGKTTALERTVSRLREDGYDVGGLSSPEIREDGERVGFELVDIASDEREVMAHVEFEDGPRVGIVTTGTVYTPIASSAVLTLRVPNRASVVRSGAH